MSGQVPRSCQVNDLGNYLHVIKAHNPVVPAGSLTLNVTLSRACFVTAGSDWFRLWGFSLACVNYRMGKITALYENTLLECRKVAK